MGNLLENEVNSWAKMQFFVLIFAHLRLGMQKRALSAFDLPLFLSLAIVARARLDVFFRSSADSYLELYGPWMNSPNYIATYLLNSARKYVNAVCIKMKCFVKLARVKANWRILVCTQTVKARQEVDILQFAV